MATTPEKKTTPAVNKEDKEKDDKVNNTSTSNTADSKTAASKDDKPEDKSGPVVVEIPTVDNKDNKDFDHGDESERKNGLSTQVVATVPNKTPNELAAETPDEADARYGTRNPTEENFDDPNVQVYRNQKVPQVPSGTHLHPDIAKDLQNYTISDRTTDSAQVVRQVAEHQVFAGDAEKNDKF